MNAKSTGKQMSINLIATVIAFGVNVGINFLLTPYLVKSLGTEAYGFIGIANNFVQYATIITAALNSMSGRFISIAYHNGDKEKASKLFSSVLIADLFLAAVLLAGTSVLTLYIDSILNVPAELVTSVKITFGITFLTFVVSVVTAIFTTAAFVKNRIDINSVRDIISNLIKVALVVALFTFLPPQLYYIALATLGSGLFLLAANVTVKKKILPDVEISFKKFEFGLVKILLTSGVWLSFSQLCNVLMSGLDLLICNIALGATVTGLLSIAKTVPNCIGNLITTVANIFTPHYTILYAKNNIKELVKEVKFTSKLSSFITTVPITGFIVFGYEFYTLWQPTKSPGEILTIQVLSILTCLMFLFTCHTQCLMMLYTVCNKLTVPVFVNFGIGIMSTAIVLGCLYFLNLGSDGVYLIAGVSSLLMSLRALVFMPVYSAKILKQKWHTFYSCILRGILTFLAVGGLFWFIKQFFPLNNWGSFVLTCLFSGIAGYILSIPLMFNKNELIKLKYALKKKIKRI